VSATLAATDSGGSGLAATRYTTDGSDPTTSSTLYTGAVAVATTSTLKFRSWDTAGNAEAVKTQLIRIDTSAPATTIACTGAPCAGWYTSARTVSLAATDTGGSGIAATRYTTNGADPTTASPLYTTPFSVSTTTTVKFRSWDTAGNVEAVKTQVIQIDPTAPVTTIRCNAATCSTGWYRAAVSLTLSVTDAGGSGVATTRYTTDGTTPSQSSTPYTGAFSVAATTTVMFRSWDVAGNAEAVKTQVVRIDATAPTVSITSPTAGASVTGTIQIGAQASDAPSGVASVTFYVDGQSVGVDSSAPYQTGWNSKKVSKGSHVLTAVATDLAGNTTTSAGVTINVT
jgi:hypothetical protein